MDIDQIQQRIASSIAGVLDWLANDGRNLLDQQGLVLTITDNGGAGVMPKLQACLMREEIVASIQLSPQLVSPLLMASVMDGMMQTAMIDKVALLASQQMVFVLSGEDEDGRADLTISEVQSGIDQLMSDWDDDIFTGTLAQFLDKRDPMVELRGVLKAIAENQKRGA